MLRKNKKNSNYDNSYNVDIFKEIFKINLLYVSPSYTEKAMKKDKYRNNPERIYNELGIRKHIMLGIFLALVYTLFFALINLAKFPYMVDISIGLFMLMNVLQTFTYFYNTFYESKDIDGYMVLPIPEETVYRAKMAVVLISTFELAIPILPIPIMYLLRIKTGILPSILIGILDFAIIYCLIIIINCILMYILSKSRLLSKMKKKLVTGITVFASILNVVMAIGIQQFSKYLTDKAVGAKSISVVYGPISYVMKDIFSNLILIGAMIIVIVIFYFVFIKKEENNFYESLREMNSIGSYSVSGKAGAVGNKSSKSVEKNSDNTIEEKWKSNENTQKVQNNTINVEKNVENVDNNGKFTQHNEKITSKNYVWKTLFKYNLSLISDTNVVSNTMMSIIFPIIMIAPQFGSIKKFVSAMTPSSRGMFYIMMGIIIGILYNMYSTGLSAVILSLDGENYNYIKTLPISEKKYIKIKIVFSVLVSSTIPVLIEIVMGILLKVPVLYIISSIFTMLAVCYGMSCLWIIYDYNHILTSWQSTSEIYSRVNKALNILIIFLLMAVLGTILGIFIYFAKENTLKPIVSAIVILVLIFLGVAIHTLNKFMNKKEIL